VHDYIWGDSEGAWCKGLRSRSYRIGILELYSMQKRTTEACAFGDRPRDRLRAMYSRAPGIWSERCSDVLTEISSR
jgi:hypothetical protein